MDEISIKYWSPHGRQEEKKFHCEDTKIDLTTRAAKKVDLSDIQRCEKLGVLNLANNMLEELDLSPLSENKTILEIHLENNHLPSLDLWPLVRCKLLERIYLTQNRLQSLDITPILARSKVMLDSSVVLSADNILRFFFTSKELAERLLLVRTDKAPWTAPPVLMWASYEELARKMDWARIRNRILSVLEHVSQEFWYHIQRGLLIGLGMKELAGFDGDPVKLLETTNNSMDYRAAKRIIFDHTVELLDEQISRNGPTLFLEIEAMKESRASKLIPKIVEARVKEIENTIVFTKGSTSLLNSLWLTHYGYKILEALKVGIRHFGIELERIKASFTDLGFSLKTQEVESLEDPDVSAPHIASQSMRRYVITEVEKAYL
ncbi:MAG: hypothetical protein ACFFDQ_10460 [Candidatus Thorarchaeota archaeon]